MKLKALSATVGLALVLAGCGTTTAEPPTSPSTATTTVTVSQTPAAPSTTPATTPTPSVEPGEASATLPAFSDGEQSNGATMTATGWDIKSVRAASHAGYDRYVIDLQSGQGEITWNASYDRPARTNGKGDDVELKGDATLNISLWGMFGMGEGPAEFLNGKQATSAGAITESYVDPPFEATGQVFIGVQTRRPYRVFMLENPTRLVVDFQK